MLFILGLAPKSLFPCFYNHSPLFGTAQILNPAHWTGSANTLRGFLCALPPGETSISCQCSSRYGQEGAVLSGCGVGWPQPPDPQLPALSNTTGRWSPNHSKERGDGTAKCLAGQKGGGCLGGEILTVSSWLIPIILSWGYIPVWGWSFVCLCFSLSQSLGILWLCEHFSLKTNTNHRHQPVCS